MKQQRILIIKLGSLGDVVQAEGVYRDLRAHHPGARIIAMTTPPYRRFFERCPWIDEVFTDRREPRWNIFKMLALRRRLQALNLDLVYDLQQVRRTHFYFRWFLPEVAWMGKAKGCAYRFEHVPGMCALEQFEAQLASLQIGHDHVLAPELGWMAADMEPFLAAAGISRPYAVLIPGASAGHDRKRWPGYASLADWLKEQGITPVIVPGPDEIESSRSCGQSEVLTDGERYLDYFELAGVLKGALFVVGNDTGPMHIAAHLGLPGLALFGTNPSATSTGIQHSRIKWLEAENLQDLALEEVKRQVRHRLLVSRAAPSDQSAL